MSNIEAAVKKLPAITAADAGNTGVLERYAAAMQPFGSQAKANETILVQYESQASHLKTEADYLATLAGRKVSDVEQPTPISRPLDTPIPT